ncbi:hypothetical protein TRFO_17516 [Tritrichomonas foetus]|uniref:BTB domain-containing protein n=1 Tax=Tritrichomonas foetus TaxID=1144522 RepID=A0A1J4KMY3_9EUKA|nr:hypothetical protein TRFO_17516 [Tritrichomonas foetus]|eukprot:OHT12673.1 hypothetical protein TRFO_17516 [Tritrichomonas foetus]
MTSFHFTFHMKRNHYVIQTTIPHQFGKLLTPQVCDFTVTYNFQQIICHKIILFKASNYFRELFLRDPTISSFELPFNPKDTFNLVIDTIYHKTLNKIDPSNFRHTSILTIDNIVPFYACIEFYGFECLQPLTKLYFDHISNKKNIFILLDAAINKYNVPQICDILLPDILVYSRDILQIDSSTTKTIQFYQICPIPIFSKILNRLLFLTRKEKIILINNFLKHKNIITLQDRETLAETIDWSLPDAYSLFIKYDLSWVPPKIARPFLFDIFEKRDNFLSLFKNEVDSLQTYSKNSIGSRWYAFMWINHIINANQSINVNQKINVNQSINTNHIINANTIDNYPEIEVTNFISTLGNTTKPLDVSLYGLIDTYGSPELDQLFEPKYALIPDHYYLAMAKNDQILFHGIDFGDTAMFKPRYIKLITNAIGNESNKNNPECITVVGFNESDGTSENLITRQTPIPDILNPKIGVIETEIFGESLFNKIQINLEGESILGFKMLRLYTVEYKGRFIPFLKDNQ